MMIRSIPQRALGWAVAVVVAVVLLAVTAGSCGRTPRLYVYVIDNSGSTGAIRSQQFDAVEAEIDDSDPLPTDQVVILRLGRTVDEVYSHWDGDIGAIGEILKQQVSKSDARSMTNYPSLAVRLLALAKQFQRYQVVIEVVGDGGNDFVDKASLKAYADAGHALVHLANVDSISFWAVDPKNRPSIESAYGNSHKLDIRDIEQEPGGLVSGR